MTIVNGHPNLVKMHSYRIFFVVVVVFVLNVMAPNYLLA
jgi:hypothetical protein